MLAAAWLSNRLFVEVDEVIGEDPEISDLFSDRVLDHLSQFWGLAQIIL